jgi:general L-amino acid transport system permease protein
MRARASWNGEEAAMSDATFGTHSTPTPVAYVRQTMAERMPPPASTAGVIGWVRSNLFDGIWGTLLTLVCAYLVWLIVPPVIRFLFIDAVWTGSGRDACLEEKVGRTVGACWPFIQAKFGQLVYGFYPAAERWRVDLTFALGVALLIPLLMPSLPYKKLNAILFFVVFPVVAFFLLVGGAFGLVHVETRVWGGLLVTLVVAVTGIVASLPLGVLLALGRRSQLPIIKTLSVIFIEFWRGVPLITVLFFATYMLPLFLPNEWTVDSLLRALVGVALFSAAYMAEVIRGGLQAIPKGQYEGAMAVGLGYWKMMGLIILPQALKLVIPGIVNTFIGLFKDTTLVLIVSIFDFLGQLRAAFSDPNWATPVTLFTGFAFAGIVYFFFCFGMSRYSLFVERRLNTSHRR